MNNVTCTAGGKARGASAIAGMSSASRSTSGYPVFAERCANASSLTRHGTFDVPMRHASQRFDVADVARGIADAFAEDRPRPIVNQLLDRLGSLRRGEAHGDALIRQQMREQGMGGAVELGNRDEIGAQPGEVERRVVDRRLP